MDSLYGSAIVWHRRRCYRASLREIDQDLKELPILGDIYAGWFECVRARFDIFGFEESDTADYINTYRDLLIHSSH
jgi:hypothetical protein